MIVFEIMTPDLDAYVTSLAYGRSKVLENIARVPDFLNSCYDVCKLLFSTFRYYPEILKFLEYKTCFLCSVCVSLLSFLVPCDVTTAPGKRSQQCITLWFFIVMCTLSRLKLCSVLKHPVYHFFRHMSIISISFSQKK